MLAIGVDAFPMVGIMAVCTGFILAMQGATELRRFGAVQFVVDLVTLGFTRELGPLLTAIAVSGRSGSAFSAEIGTMVVTEEIDALRTMAIDPAGVFARAQIPGGADCASLPDHHLQRVWNSGGRCVHAVQHHWCWASVSCGLGPTPIVLNDVLTGLLKSLAFATIIVQVGCLEGFRVQGGPDAVGRSTTSAHGRVDVPGHPGGCGLHSHLLSDRGQVKSCPPR